MLVRLVVLMMLASCKQDSAHFALLPGTYQEVVCTETKSPALFLILECHSSKAAAGEVAGHSKKSKHQPRSGVLSVPPVPLANPKARGTVPSTCAALSSRVLWSQARHQIKHPPPARLEQQMMLRTCIRSKTQPGIKAYFAMLKHFGSPKRIFTKSLEYTRIPG